MTSQKTNTAEVAFRFGSWGPGYLSQDSQASFGIVRLRPGDRLTNHYHEKQDESFLVIEGTAELWLNRSERIALSYGDFIRCKAGTEHYLRNQEGECFVAFFVKAPGIPGDKVEAPWSPSC